MQLVNNHDFKKYALMAGAVAAAVVISNDVLAGTSTANGADAFQGVWTFLSDTMKGSLGRVAAGAMVLVGIIAGVARQSLMGFAVGTGAGVGVYAAPGVIEDMVSATLAAAPAATSAVLSISNGL